jgi:isopentenyldiphosphate isomerase
MELMDVYDEERQKTGRTMERAAQPAPGDHRLVVHLCVFNRAGELLVQRRAPEKYTYPLRWDVTAAGAVDAGETSRQAVARETREELGIDLDPDRFVKVFSLYYDNSIHDIYNLVLEPGETYEYSVPNEEVAAVKWASEEEILDMLDSRTFLPVYKEFIDLLFRMKTRKGIVTY